MQWSGEQDKALKSVDKWFFQESKRKTVFRIFGYAGTGKSTLAKHFAENIDGIVHYAAFTGKAADVMRKKGCHGASTIHSLIYKAETNEITGETTFHLNRQSPLKDAALLIIDECSMVDESLGADLLSFRVPILVLGDPAQLPPVEGAGFFTDATPDIMLTEIHRQAKDNPIIYLSTMIREGVIPKIGDYGSSKVVNKVSTGELLQADQVLVGRNATRTAYNQKMRKLLNFNTDEPQVNDRLICLANDKELGIFNGGLFKVSQLLTTKKNTNFLHMRLESEDEVATPKMVKVHKSFFMPEVKTPDWKSLKGSQRFDYAYTITTHKSQGSQWENVLIKDESYCFRDDKFKWLYTAATRASESIILWV